MIIAVTRNGETFEHELPDDMDLELWLLGYTNDGNDPISNLKIVEWGF